MPSLSKTDLVPLITRLRWLIPLAVALVGALFILANEIMMEGRNPFSLSILTTFFVLVLCGPAFAWFTLNWATHVAVAQALAQEKLAASTAENQRLYQGAQRRAQHLEAASLVGQRITALLDQDALLSEVAKLIGSRFGYYHTHIFLVEEATKELVLRAVNGPSSQVMIDRGVRLKIDSQGITPWVARTGQAVVCNDVSKEPRFLSVELLPETRAELAIPLRVGSRVVGVLDVQSNRLNSFDKEDVTVLQVLGSQLGISFENARLFAETKRRYGAMVALHETSLDIVSELDRAKVFNGLLQRGVHLWNAKGGLLMIYSATRNELYNAASYNIPFESVHMRPNEGFIGKVFESGEPMMLEDYNQWEGRLSIYSNTPLPVAMAAPLKWQDQKIGVVLIANDKKMRLFDRNDLWLLSLFADLGMIAIRNAELHTQVTTLSHDLEDKVIERTAELSLATHEIARKADQLRNLLAKTIHLQEQERARIAREMHDGVIQMGSAIRYELKAAEIALDSSNAQDAALKVRQARQVLTDMEQEIRHAIYDLHPLALDAIDLVPALRKYTKNFQAISGILCNLNVYGQVCPLPLPVQVAIFRIVEQGLQNVVTHAGATETTVELDFGNEVLCFQVHDNGRGFDPLQHSSENRANHLGLVSMGERARNLNGKMEIDSKPGDGTHLRFTLPLMQANQNS